MAIDLTFRPLWGYISDRIGRRPVLLFGVVGTIISVTLLGFSKWYWMAIVSRLMYGAFNGNLGVVKTYIRESTDKTNQARAFSIIGLTYAIGVIFGPLIGGFLSRPAPKLPILFDNWFFVNFPYALPNLVLALISIIAFILGWFFLIETRVASLHEPAPHVAGESRIKRWWRGFRTSSILTSRAPLLTCIGYAMMGLSDTVYLEVFPIWVWTPVQNKGLGLDPTKIGLLNMIIGVFVFVSQLAFTPWIAKRVGIRNGFILTAILAIPPCFMLVDLYRVVDIPILMYLLLGSIHLWRVVWIEVCFTFSMMMINNSVDSASLGTINGIAQSMVAFTRTIGPASGSALFALSISVDIPYLFDVHFIFFMCGLTTIILIPIGFLIRKSIDEPILPHDIKQN